MEALLHCLVSSQTEIKSFYFDVQLGLIPKSGCLIIRMPCNTRWYKKLVSQWVVDLLLEYFEQILIVVLKSRIECASFKIDTVNFTHMHLNERGQIYIIQKQHIANAERCRN